MTQLSHNAEMARTLLAMTIGLPIYSDPGLREDTYWLISIDDILTAANCFADVEREMRENDVLNETCCPDSWECGEALKWALEKTNPERILALLAHDNAFYFMTEGEETSSMFEDGKLHFFMEHCRRLPRARRLKIVAEAIHLADWTANKGVGAKAMPDLLRFAKEELANIKLQRGSPAYSRRNLLWAGIQCMIGDIDRKVAPVMRRVTFSDLKFGASEMVRLTVAG